MPHNACQNSTALPQLQVSIRNRISSFGYCTTGGLGGGGWGVPGARWAGGWRATGLQERGTDHTAVEGLGGGCALVLDPRVLQGLVGCQPLCWLPDQQTLQSPLSEPHLLSMQ